MGKSKSMRLPNDEILHYKSDDGVTVIVERTELVRCKDCKHYSHDVDANEGEWDCCRVYGMFVDPNDFCSEGERKDGTK